MTERVKAIADVALIACRDQGGWVGRDCCCAVEVHSPLIDTLVSIFPLFSSEAAKVLSRSLFLS